LDSGYIQVYMNRGYLFDQLGHPEKALPDFSQAISLDPEDSGKFSTRARIYEQQKEYDLALADWERASALSPRDAWLHAIQGTLYMTRKQYPQALVAFNQAIAIDPKYAWAHTLRGDAHIQLAQFPQAQADYQQAAALDKDYSYQADSKKEDFEALKQSQQSIERLLKTGHAGPSLALAYFDRGLAYQNLGNAALALKDYSEAILLNPRYLEAYSARAGVFRELSEYLPAIVEYNFLIKLEPNNSDHYYYRAQAHSLQGDFQEALADWDAYFNLLSPEQAKSISYGYLQRVEAQLALKQYPNVIAACNRFIGQGTYREQDLLLKRGEAYLGLGRYEEAIADFQEVMHKQPESQVFDKVGQAYLGLNHKLLALQAFARATENSPGNVETYLNHAKLAQTLGQNDKARDDWEMACWLGEQSACDQLSQAAGDASVSQQPE
ncbi:MAG: tetratricopeptide repeat protein, partial [Candidatus Sericytochromatia bacterium]